MESGSSGSLQSSSCGGGGGDEEFDSRCADSSPLSALLRQSTAGFGGSFYGLRHEHETSSSSTPLPPLPQAVHHWSPALPAPAGDGASPSSSSSHGVPAASADTAAVPAQQPSSQPAPPRGSRKRTRASRRAPTTVLTTDTSNFRAMVQEFTGIPSPPFSAGSTSAVRSRFDHLFHSSLRSSPNPTPSGFPPYLLRPFAQKHHHHQPSPSSLFPSSSFASPPPSQSSIGTAPLAVTAACVSSSITAMASSGSYQYHHLLAPDPIPTSAAALLGSSRDHHHHSSNYLSFQSPLAAAGATHPMFDTLSAPPLRPQEENPVASSFLGRTHHAILGSSEGTHLHLHPRVDHGHRQEDELSGLVGSGVCRTTTYSSAVPGAALATPRLLDRNVDSTTSAAATTATTTSTAAAAMRTRGVDSWICTSE